MPLLNSLYSYLQAQCELGHTTRFLGTELEHKISADGNPYTMLHLPRRLNLTSPHLETFSLRQPHITVFAKSDYRDAAWHVTANVYHGDVYVGIVRTYFTLAGSCIGAPTFRAHEEEGSEPFRPSAKLMNACATIAQSEAGPLIKGIVQSQSDESEHLKAELKGHQERLLALCFSDEIVTAERLCEAARPIKAILDKLDSWQPGFSSRKRDITAYIRGLERMMHSEEAPGPLARVPSNDSSVSSVEDFTTGSGESALPTAAGGPTVADTPEHAFKARLDALRAGLAELSRPDAEGEASEEAHASDSLRVEQLLSRHRRLYELMAESWELVETGSAKPQELAELTLRFAVQFSRHETEIKESGTKLLRELLLKNNWELANQLKGFSDGLPKNLLFLSLHRPDLTLFNWLLNNAENDLEQSCQAREGEPPKTLLAHAITLKNADAFRALLDKGAKLSAIGHDGLPVIVHALSTSERPIHAVIYEHIRENPAHYIKFWEETDSSIQAWTIAQEAIDLKTFMALRLFFVNRDALVHRLIAQRGTGRAFDHVVPQTDWFLRLSSEARITEIRVAPLVQQAVERYRETEQNYLRSLPKARKEQFMRKSAKAFAVLDGIADEETREIFAHASIADFVSLIDRNTELLKIQIALSEVSASRGHLTKKKKKAINEIRHDLKRVEHEIAEIIDAIERQQRIEALDMIQQGYEKMTAAFLKLLGKLHPDTLQSIREALVKAYPEEEEEWEEEEWEEQEWEEQEWDLEESGELDHAARVSRTPNTGAERPSIFSRPVVGAWHDEDEYEEADKSADDELTPTPSPK